jgi:thioredoxin-related protein
MLKPIFLSVFVLSLFSGAAQNYAVSKIKWLSVEEVDQQQRSNKQPKKIMIDLYTDNCGWCKKMDFSTFQNEFISHYLNENFIPVRFNAQAKKEISFNQQTFKLDKSGYHELAIALSLGDLGFPTLVFLDESNQIIQPIQGYQTVDELEKIMYYFANDLYKNTPWNEFVQHFKPTNSKPKKDHGRMETYPSSSPLTEQVKKKN